MSFNRLVECSTQWIMASRISALLSLGVRRILELAILPSKFIFFDTLLFTSTSVRERLELKKG